MSTLATLTFACCLLTPLAACKSGKFFGAKEEAHTPSQGGGTGDTEAPTASVSGQPTGTSRTTSLSAAVSGGDVAQYRFKVGPAASTDCAVSDGYGVVTVVAEPLAGALSAVPDGDVALCVVGIDAAGNTDYALAARVTWVKDTLAPSVPAAFSGSAVNGQVALSWTSGGGSPAGYVLVKRAGTGVAWTPVDGTAYAEGALADGQTIIHSASGTSDTDTAVTNGTTYHYALYAFDEVYNYSAAVGLTATPGPSIAWSTPYVTNGTVRAMATSGNTLYLGGSFSYVGPYTGSGMPFDAGTGGVPAGVSWPAVNGQVNAAIADPSEAGSFFIGGAFTRVGGTTRGGLARIRPDGTVDPAWDPSTDGSVNVLLLSGTTLFIGGSFTAVDGIPRTNLAAVGAGTTGLLDVAWAPTTDGSVHAMAIDAGIIYLGGSFLDVNGVSRPGLAAVLESDGSLNGWTPPEPNGTVYALAVVGGNVYIGGDFVYIGDPFDPGDTYRRPGLGSVTTGGALTAWTPELDGDVRALALDGTTLYVGGTFGAIGLASRGNLAAFDTTTGTLTGWNPSADSSVYALSFSGAGIYVGGAFSTIAGEARTRLALVNDTTGGAVAWSPNVGGDVLAIAASGGRVYAGGSFTSVGGSARANLAAVDIITGVPTAWAPQANSTVNALAVASSTVFAGGNFTVVNSLSMRGVAALQTAGAGALAPGWNATLNPAGTAIVYALAVDGTTLYLGGQLTSAGGQARGNAAAVSTSNGSVLPWNPSFSGGPVRALAVAGDTVYLGGSFTAAGIKARTYLAATNATDGTATDWSPTVSVSSGTPVVNTIAVSGSTVYVGGNFTTVLGTARNRLAAIDRAGTGTLLPWNPNVNNVVSAIVVDGRGVYVGGSFTRINGTTVVRNRAALIDPTSGTTLAWDVSANGTVNAILPFGESVLVGGGFSLLGTSGRPSFGAVGLGGGAL